MVGGEGVVMVMVMVMVMVKVVKVVKGWGATA